MSHTDRRSILGQKRSFWGVIESFEKSSSEFYETIVNVRGIPGVKYVLFHEHGYKILRERVGEREGRGERGVFFIVQDNGGAWKSMVEVCADAEKDG